MAQGMAPNLDSLVKRGADVIVSGAALALSLPFWVWAMFAIGLSDGWPFLYSQNRVGRNGRLFRLYKFRSMVKDAEKHTSIISSGKDDPRVTRVGRIMRKTAVDEIPQLLNIMRGDMSWVGPRAARPQEVAQFRQQLRDYDLRHRVRPGLTGLAQVCGRNYDDVAEKLGLDLYYIRHWSLFLDLQLFIRSWVNTALGRWEAARGGTPNASASENRCGGNEE